MLWSGVGVLKLKNGSSPKSGTSNVMSILVSFGVLSFMENEVSGNAEAKDASNAVCIIECVEVMRAHKF